MYFTGIQDANFEEIKIAEKMNFCSLDDVRNYMKYGTTDIVEIQKQLGITQKDKNKILEKFKQSFLDQK